MKNFKYKVGDKVRFEKYDVIIKGMNYYSSSNILTYMVKGYPLGHGGYISSYHYDELGSKIHHVEGDDYYYVDEYNLKLIESAPSKSKFKYKVGDKVKYDGEILTIVGINCCHNSPLLDYLCKGYSKGHDGITTSENYYDEKGNKIKLENTHDYYYIDEVGLSPAPSVSEKFPHYYLGQRVKVKFGNKEYVGTIEGFTKNWRRETTDVYSIRFCGKIGHNGIDSKFNHDETGKSINFISKSSDYWFISPDQILETYPEFNTKSIDDITTTHVPNILDKTDKYDGYDIKIIPPWWVDEIPDGLGEVIKNKSSHQSAIVMKSPNGKTKFNFIRK